MRLVSTTIAANGETSIGDALRSVVGWVDACIVIDTGITDGTLEVARNVVGEKLLVRKLRGDAGSSAARNFAFEVADNTGADWVVTVDPDERLVLEGVDVRLAISKHVASVLSVENELRTQAKERFFRMPMAEKWSGFTHETIDASGMLDMPKLPSIRFRQLPKDRIAALRKLERDIGLLESCIRRDPLTPRWHYYLGESYRQLKRYHEAIAAYETCIDLRGWNEEGAWACYHAAECHLKLGDLRRAVESCVAGSFRHTGLAELPWLAAVASYRLGNYHQAIYWAKLAIEWASSCDGGRHVSRVGPRYLPGIYEGPYDVLRFALRATGNQAEAEEAEHRYDLARTARLYFDDKPGAARDIEHDLTIATHSYAMGRRDDGLRACERILARSLSLSRNALIRRTRSWYTKPLDALLATRFVRFDIQPAYTGWSLSNPTILYHEGAWLAMIHSSSGSHENGRHPVPEGCSRRCKSESMLVELTTSLMIEQARVCTRPSYPHSGYSAEGLKDCRLRLAADGVHVSGTLRDHVDFHGLCRVATARLDPTSAVLSDLHVLHIPRDFHAFDPPEALHEKNWMPILGQDRWLYHCSHGGWTTVVERVIVDDREQCRIELRSPSPRIARRFRGGSQLVPVEGSWLALVHEVVLDGDRRIHEHRFVRFDDDFAIISYSPQFCFRETRTIELAAGLAAAGDRLVATFGVRDVEAWMVELDTREVLALTNCH